MQKCFSNCCLCRLLLSHWQKQITWPTMSQHEKELPGCGCRNVEEIPRFHWDIVPPMISSETLSLIPHVCLSWCRWPISSVLKGPLLSLVSLCWGFQTMGSPLGMIQDTLQRPVLVTWLRAGLYKHLYSLSSQTLGNTVSA